MFRGLTSINIDAKGRMAVPMRYREALHHDGAYHLVITIDTEASCLLLYPIHAWELIEEKLQQLSSFNKTTRRIQRLLIGHATELEMDSNGRVLIPPLLREYAGITKKAILVGQGKKFELWDEDRWQKKRDQWIKEQIDPDEELPDELQDLSL